ncbi:hypothetical protein DPX39_080030600 [Trypanosoma brucei equiperdum]|uniref:Uncharacterized protein n=1 Tax=Trypanosoma brucei equiperdum TaxID=630700 RepID=A0A3L6L6Q5_9TRYP|nr:hypothetical protein DPX39_080030600 [Trypanosoma brucei equiperdum]
MYSRALPTYIYMLPQQRLRLILTRSVGVLAEISSVQPRKPPFDEQQQAFHSHVQHLPAKDIFSDLLVSASALGVGSREDWLRLKKVYLARLPELPCPTVVMLLRQLVKNDACGLVECVSIQDRLAESHFLTTLKTEEQMEALSSIVIVGSRLSPKFMPYAQEALRVIISGAQVELLPELSYVVGCLVTSEDNGISAEAQSSILKELLERVRRVDYTLLTQEKLVYLFWSLSTFCSSIIPVRLVYIEVCEAIVANGIRTGGVESASPRNDLLLLCGLCQIVSVSGSGDRVVPIQSEGVINNVSWSENDCLGCLSPSFTVKLLAILDSVVLTFVQRVVKGEIQNRFIISTVLESLTYCGLTKLQKNAQILFHILLRMLMYNGIDFWLRPLGDAAAVTRAEAIGPLVNVYSVAADVTFLDRLMYRLNFCVFPAVSQCALEKATVKQVRIILEAIAYGNLTVNSRKFYLGECFKIVPGIVRNASRWELPRIINAVMKLSIKDNFIWCAIRERSRELGYQHGCRGGGYPQTDTKRHEVSGKCSEEDTNSSDVALQICEKALMLSESEGVPLERLTHSLETLCTRKGMKSSTMTQCAAIVGSLSKLRIPSRGFKPYTAVSTPIFLRLEVLQYPDWGLSLILDGAAAGVSRTVLLNSLSAVGTRLLQNDLGRNRYESAVFYLIAAHELDARYSVLHPHIVGTIRDQQRLQTLPFHILVRLVGALCAFGIDEKCVLERALHRVDSLCVHVVEREKWVEADWRAALVLVNAMWTSAAKTVWKSLIHVTRKLVIVMIKRIRDGEVGVYPLQAALAIATVVINDLDNSSMGYADGKVNDDIVTAFLNIVAPLFSEDGVSFSLPRAEALLRSEFGALFPPQCNSLTCSLVVSHALQRLIQMNNDSAKRFTPHAIGLWRFCLKHIEKAPLTDRTLMNTVTFCVRFGGSSQTFDRFMASLVDSGDEVSMLDVCLIAEGLLKNGKRRPIATQFIAHFSQKLPLDNLPAAALCSLLLFFARDAEKVALGLSKVEMLLSLVWASLALKMDRLAGSGELLKLVETVPANAANPLLRLICDTKAIDDIPTVELVRPLNIVLGWKTNTVSPATVLCFLQKVGTSIELREKTDPAECLATEEMKRMIHCYSQ